MEINITSADGLLTSERLKERLEKLPAWDDSVVLEVRQAPGPRLRNLEPTVLVAIVSAAGTALGALIAGLLQIAQANRKEKITLVLKSGQRIEFEGRNAKKNIEDLIKLVESAEPNRIII